MTVRMLIEENKPDFIEIKNHDYRGCRPMKREDFLREYEGTDVMVEEPKKAIHTVRYGKLSPEEAKFLRLHKGMVKTSLLSIEL